MISKYILIILLTQFVFSNCLAQKVISRSHGDRLPWIKGELPKKNSTFDYLISRGEGKSLSDARDEAFTSFLLEMGNDSGIKVNSQSINKIKSELKYDSGKTTYDETTSMDHKFEIEREIFIPPFAKLSEYYEYVITNGSYEYLVWELYAISKNEKIQVSITEYTTDYGLDAVWRSAIVPGWGQFYKKKTGKGIAILASEAALISTTVYCESMRSDNMRKSAETTNLDITKEYRKRADTWELRRNIAIGGAVAVYAFNLLDAALAKGQIKYAFIPDNLELLAYKEGNINQFGIQIKL